MFSIRKATPADEEALWGILEPVIRAGETYDFPRDTDRASALRLAGTRQRVLRRARRRARAGHLRAPRHAQGRGVARALCAHSLDAARAAGFRAMQFNFVVASNHRAVALWHRMGFDTVGRVPEAFHHPVLGYTDALMMYRRL